MAFIQFLTAHGYFFICLIGQEKKLDDVFKHVETKVKKEVEVFFYAEV